MGRKPDKTFTKVIGSKRYSVEKATLIADDLYLDERGQGYDRGGRNTFLYRTPKGAYFTVTTFTDPRDTDVLNPVSLDEAIELYNGMRKDKRLPFAEAFPGVEITDA